MDFHTSAIEDTIVPQIDFKLNPGASYITARDSVTFPCSGSQAYVSNQGSRLIKVIIAGDGWLDPSTVKLSYRYQLQEQQPLRVLSGGWSFSVVQDCHFNGEPCEDIDYYNKVHELFHVLSSKNNRDNDLIQGFGPYRWDSDDIYKKL
jgi:hypothetical protein